MIYQTLILMPFFPITSHIPPHEQCTTKLVHWSKNVDVVVKKCATQEITLTRYKVRNEK